jgi:WD40 repeat protein
VTANQNHAACTLRANTSVAFSPDGRTLADGSSGTIHLWATQT